MLVIFHTISVGRSSVRLSVCTRKIIGMKKYICTAPLCIIMIYVYQMLISNAEQIM